MQISTIRPGLLVALTSRLSGNVEYDKKILEADRFDPDTGARRAKWETERMIVDPEEYERAVKARGRARSIITAVCSISAFGLLCPEDKRSELTAAIAAARDIAQDFNRSARVTEVTVNVIVGRIAADDAEAVRAINREVRDLLEQMESGIRKLDAKEIRDAANKTRSLSAMLTPVAARSATAAIESARAFARQIVKAGESAAIEVDQAAIRQIQESRTAFLDLDTDDRAVEAPIQQVARAVDFVPEVAEQPAPMPQAPARQVTWFDDDDDANQTEAA